MYFEKNNRKTKWLIAAACSLLAAVSFSGCRGEKSPAAEAGQEYCTVSFYLDKQDPICRQFPVGTVLQQVPGKTETELLVWRDTDRKIVNPAEYTIREDVSFYEEKYPRLTRENPCLTSVDHRLRPEDPLTFGEFYEGIRALSAEDLSGILEIPIHPDYVMEVRDAFESLRRFYPGEALEKVLPEERRRPFTRRDFAEAMYLLQQRNPEHPVLIRSLDPWFRDVSWTREQDRILMIMSLYYDRTSAGRPWQEALSGAEYTPGFFLTAGELHCADEAGKLICGGEKDSLQFDSRGCYTSGNPELDTLTVSLIRKFMQQDPEAEREELLMAAFLYCRDEVTYVRREYHYVGETGWDMESAVHMLKTLHGNCYDYAAAFWALARNLGYDARCVSGRILDSKRQHGWVMIDFDGYPYIFDPEIAYLGAIGYRDNYGEDMFKIPLWDAVTWKYVFP